MQNPFKKLLAFSLLGASCSVLAGTPVATLVINEVDYDTAGTDVAEFMELKNVSAGAINLSLYEVVFVNGNAGGAAIYDTIALPATSLAAGDYFVICANAANTINCDLDDAPDSNFLQNGAPDAIAVRLAGGGAIADTVSYEGNTGAPYTESSGVGLIDDGVTNFQGISRFPDGADSDVNNVDLSVRCITPGTTNLAASTGCTAPVTLSVLSIANAMTTGEGNPGCSAASAKLVYPVTAVPAPASSLAFTANISGGTADGADVGTLATVNVDTSGNGSVEVPIVCDRVIEGDETVQVTLVDGAAYDLGTASANGTIENDDVGVIRIGDVSQAEGTGANSTFTFTAAMDNGVLAGAGGIAFDYEIVAGGGTPATATVDFTTVSTTAHSIAAGQNSAVISVTIIADSDDEPDETFAVNLSNAIGASIGDNQAIGTIQNDDAVIPQVSIDDVSISEGDTGTANLAFTVSINAPPTGANVVVDFDTASGTAVEPGDFTDTSGQLSFPIGSTASQQILVPIVGDCSIESPASETFSVNLTLNSGSATVESSGTGTINDNDVAITADISVAPASAAEGHTGTNTRTVTVSLSQAMQCGDFTYSIATSGAASSGTDYQAFSVSNATISGANTQATHTLTINGDLDNESDEDVVLTLTGSGTNVGGLPDTANATIANDDSAPLTIEQIQGNGISSPVANQVVTTLGNIVTAIQPAPNGGFFIQMPDAQASADAATSNAIFVFTGPTPPYATGDLVDVRGTVLEFGGMTTPAERRVTEFGAGGLVVVVRSSGNPLPSAAVLNDVVPSPEPTVPYCFGGSIPTTMPAAVQNFECLEGMRASVSSGVVSAPNQSFGGGTPDFYAEMHFSTGGTRAFREQGVAFDFAGENTSTAVITPPAPPLPAGFVWDGNPEVFELDPNKLDPGTANNVIVPGSTISGSGIVQQEFNDYEFWPQTLTVTNAAPALPAVVPDRVSDQLSVGSLNLLRLYDRCNDPARPSSGETVNVTQTAMKLRKISSYIRNVLKNPIVMGVQEAEHPSAPGTVCSNAEVTTSALQLLADQIVADGGPQYTVQYGTVQNDPGFINNGVLYRADLISNPTFSQWRPSDQFSFSYTDGQMPPQAQTRVATLHDRPTLLMRGTANLGGPAFDFAVAVNHLRSLNGIDDLSDTYASGDTTSDPTIHQNAHRVRQKRLRQAIDVACEAQLFQAANPTVPLVLVGDFNAFEVSDGYSDTAGIIRGDADAAANEYDVGFDNTPNCALQPNGQLVMPGLAEALFALPRHQQYSYTFAGSAQTLDHAFLTSAAVDRFEGLHFGRGNADAPARERAIETPGLEMLGASDHDGFVVYLNTGNDRTNNGFVIFANGFED